jgi:hypothetical protein
MEQTVYNSLFTLIKDTSVLRDYAAAAILIVQVGGGTASWGRGPRRNNLGKKGCWLPVGGKRGLTADVGSSSRPPLPVANCCLGWLYLPPAACPLQLLKYAPATHPCST